MEAAAIARLAAMRGIPFYCVKGVSDGFPIGCRISTGLLGRRGISTGGFVTLFASEAVALARTDADGRE
jgi:hypothetical protein